LFESFLVSYQKCTTPIDPLEDVGLIMLRLLDDIHKTLREDDASATQFLVVSAKLVGVVGILVSFVMGVVSIVVVFVDGVSTITTVVVLAALV
jgi:hypothetical protein